MECFVFLICIVIIISGKPGLWKYEIHKLGKYFQIRKLSSSVVNQIATAHTGCIRVPGFLLDSTKHCSISYVHFCISDEAMMLNIRLELILGDRPTRTVHELRKFTILTKQIGIQNIITAQMIQDSYCGNSVAWRYTETTRQTCKQKDKQTNDSLESEPYMRCQADTRTHAS